MLPALEMVQRFFLSTFNEDPLCQNEHFLGDGGVVVLLQINYACVP